MSGWECKGDCSSWSDHMKPCSVRCRQGKKPPPLYDVEFWEGVTAKIEARRKAMTPPLVTDKERMDAIFRASSYGVPASVIAHWSGLNLRRR